MEPLNPCSPPDLRHLQRLTDAFGVIQHTTGGHPDAAFGYALDDVARAFIVVSETRRLFSLQATGNRQQTGGNEERTLEELADLSLRFIEYCQRPDGRFHNFIAIDRSFRDDVGSTDAYGRTLWALGVAIRNAKGKAQNAKFLDRAARAFRAALPHVRQFSAPRSRAFALLGLCAVLQEERPLDVLQDTIFLLSSLLQKYAEAAREDWPWFEDILVYSNAALPYALLVAARSSPLTAHRSQLVDRARAVGLKTLDFLLRVLRVDGVPAPVGNTGWFLKGGTRALYDQQCVDAAAIVVASTQASVVTGDARYHEAAETWWGWFFGNNTKQLPLYRPEDGAVYDGLTPEGVNENRGAESVLVFLLAHLALAEVVCPAPRPSAGHEH